MKTALLVFLSVITGTSVFANTPVTPLPQNTREIITIRWLSKTLIRMGEAATAKRLVEDYYTNRRIRFADMNSADGNAETGIGTSGHNEITLSSALLNTAEQQELLEKRPYGPSSNLINDAMTIIHEYVHMDQTMPMNYPRWENPAWQKTDRTLNNWVKKIEAEYNAARKLPASKEKTDKLTELSDIVKKLKAEAVSVRNSITGNVKNKSLSAGQNWLIGDSEKRLNKLTEDQKKYETVEKMVPQPSAKAKNSGYWEIVDKKAFDKLSPNDNNYSLTAGDGSVTTKWWMGDDRMEFTATYTVPPNRIYPTDKIPFSIAVSVSNKGDYYSASGNVAVFFDNPDIEPGSVSSPIGLKGGKDTTGYIQVFHKPGMSPAPASSVNVFITGSSLPTGRAGARIALIVAVYNGRNAGYRYTYEWKTN